MNYPPKHHQDSNRNHLIQVIKNYPLATVISVLNNEPVITHVPLILKDQQLIGHIDANNPHALLLKNNQKVTLLFSGPQCYISPSIYKTAQLPTWNYIKVHLKGLVSEIENPDSIKQSIVEMTQFLEAPEHTFQLDYEDARMDKFVPYIKGFKITITDWEGKFKLSQDKNAEDFESAKAQMIKHNQVHIGAFLNNLFQNN